VKSFLFFPRPGPFRDRWMHCSVRIRDGSLFLKACLTPPPIVDKENFPGRRTAGPVLFSSFLHLSPCSRQSVDAAFLILLLLRARRHFFRPFFLFFLFPPSVEIRIVSPFVKKRIGKWFPPFPGLSLPMRRNME